MPARDGRPQGPPLQNAGGTPALPGANTRAAPTTHNIGLATPGSAARQCGQAPKGLNIPDRGGAPAPRACPRWAAARAAPTTCERDARAPRGEHKVRPYNENWVPSPLGLKSQAGATLKRVSIPDQGEWPKRWPISFPSSDYGVASRVPNSINLLISWTKSWVMSTRC